MTVLKKTLSALMAFIAGILGNVALRHSRTATDYQLQASIPKSIPAHHSISRERDLKIDLDKSSYSWDISTRGLAEAVFSLPPGIGRLELFARLVKECPTEGLLAFLSRVAATDDAMRDELLALILGRPDAESFSENLLRLTQCQPCMLASLERVLPVLLKDSTGTPCARLLFGDVQYSPVLKSKGLAQFVAGSKPYCELAIQWLDQHDSIKLNRHFLEDRIISGVLARDSSLRQQVLAEFPSSRYAEGVVRSDIAASLLHPDCRIDPLLVELGGRSSGESLIEDQLWKLAESDPRLAVNLAAKSKHPRFSEDLARRLYLNWRRKSKDAADRARVDNMWSFGDQ